MILAPGRPKPNPREDLQRYSGAVNVGPGVVRDDGSLVSQQTLEFVRDEGSLESQRRAGFVGDEASLQSQRRPQQEETPDQRRSPELFDYFTAEDRRTEVRRPCYKGNEENWHGCSETIPMPTNSSRSIEGMSSFKE